MDGDKYVKNDGCPVYTTRMGEDSMCCVSKTVADRRFLFTLYKKMKRGGVEEVLGSSLPNDLHQWMLTRKPDSWVHRVSVSWRTDPFATLVLPPPEIFRNPDILSFLMRCYPRFDIVEKIRNNTDRALQTI